MLGLQAAGYKRGLADAIAIVLLISIAIVLIIILWVHLGPVLSKSPTEKSVCLEPSLSIEKACYLNENEIKLTLARSFDNLEINSLTISFSPYEARFKIRDKKCSDVRLEAGVYGSYCRVLGPGERFSYIFNLDGIGKENKASLLANINNVDCEIESLNIGRC